MLVLHMLLTKLLWAAWARFHRSSLLRPRGLIHAIHLVTVRKNEGPQLWHIMFLKVPELKTEISIYKKSVTHG